MRARSIVIFFLGLVVLYLGTFYGLEWLRQRKGAWQVAFQADQGRNPTIVVSQPKLGLSDVRIVLHGEIVEVVDKTVVFDRVQTPVPFGRVLYEDLTFLPGVLTFDLFGHEIELLSRVLIADRKEFPWRSGETVHLWPTNKPAEPLQPISESVN